MLFCILVAIDILFTFEHVVSVQKHITVLAECSTISRRLGRCTLHSGTVENDISQITRIPNGALCRGSYVNKKSTKSVVIHHSLSKFCLHCLLTIDLSFLRLVQEYLHIILLYIHLISLSSLPQLSLAISAFLSLPHLHLPHTVKKEKNICLIQKENQKGSGAQSYMTNGLLIYD
jgi:hypothetical protein